jgi:hypothetical protein
MMLQRVSQAPARRPIGMFLEPPLMALQSHIGEAGERTRTADPVSPIQQKIPQTGRFASYTNILSRYARALVAFVQVWQADRLKEVLG